MIEKTHQDKKISDRSKILFGVFIGLFFLLCTELYRRMSVGYKGVLGIYYSDIILRLEMGVGQSYSILLNIEYFFFEKFGLNTGALFVGIYLSLFTVGTVIAIYYLLKNLYPGINKSLLYLASFSSLFLIPIACFPISEKLYGPYVGSVWHNETYLGMRFVAILLLIFFYRTCDQYLKRFTAKDFVVECFLFLIVNSIKPNFTIAFAPAMLVMMIVDIIKAKGKGLGRWMLFGIPVLIGALVFINQYSNLFAVPTDAVSNEEESHIIFVFFDTFKNQKHPFFNFLTSFAFPISILVIHCKEFFRSKFNLICLLSWIISFLEYAFISESGYRSNHGNFSWGLHFFSFLIFCLCVGYFFVDVQKTLKARKKVDESKKSKVSISVLIEGVLFIGHLFSGLFYFVLILLGCCGHMI